MACGVSFVPTGKGYQCKPCRKSYDTAWRARRRAEGKPASGTTTWDPQKRAAWKERYYSRRDIRARKAIRAARRRSNPAEAHTCHRAADAKAEGK